MIGSLAASKVEALDFKKSKDISDNDKEFVRKHDYNWGHGGLDFYSLVTYIPNLAQATVLASSQKGREIHFVPRLSFSHLESYINVLSESYFSGELAKELKRMDPVEAERFRSDESTLPFTGLLNAPEFWYCTGGVTGPLRKASLFCYQTHFEVGEITYMFGGLQAEPHRTLKQLGIPKNTEFSQISVHFDQPLPPYFNKDVFMSPLMGFNYTFITFNPTRGTVHEYPLIHMTEQAPGSICDMQGTQISETQVFFCGGFYVNIDNVTYKPELNRWIVEKSISLNNEGFILDTRRMSFTKIDIVAKLEVVFRGRIGATLSSSYFSPCSVHDDSSSINLNHEPENQIKDLYVAEQSLLNQSAVGKSTSTIPTLKHELGPVPALNSPFLDQSLKTVEKKNSLRPQPNPTPKGSSNRVSPIVSPSATGKKASLLSKSSRLFHRNMSKQTTNSNQPSVYSLYSNQVKQHRSQSLPIQADSRLSSPQYLHKLSGNKLTVDTQSDSKVFDSLGFLLSPPKISTPLAETPILDPRSDVKSPDGSVLSEGDTQQMSQENSKSELQSVCVYMFGGFHFLKNPETEKHFVASNKLLKIELLIEDSSQSKFHNKALIIEVMPESDVVPLPRGFFAYFLADVELSFESCKLYSTPLQVGSDAESLRLSDSYSDEASGGHKLTAVHSKCDSGDSQLNRKRLVIHGGVDEKRQVFSDFYAFTFSTGTWEKMPTYAYDYYEKPKLPTEDEDVELLKYELQVANAELREAEFRCCHHRATTYSEDGKTNVIFCGGYTNDYLRHFDEEPYASEVLDVSRLARLQFVSDNSNVLRLPVLNLSTQTWKFPRYFYDLREIITPEAGKILTGSYMKNSRLTFVGGAFLRVGKQLTICHGLATLIPEKAEDFRKMQKEHSSCVFLLGGHLHLTLPGI